MKSVFALIVLLGTTYVVVTQAFWFLAPTTFVERTVTLAIVTVLGSFTIGIVNSIVDTAMKVRE